MSSFRDHVKRAAKLAGGQVELATRIGISQSEVSRLCTSAKSIPPRTALAIVKATNGEITLRDLIPDVVEVVRSEAAA